MDDVDIGNRSTYERSDVVDWYSTQSELQPAERAILERLAPQLRGARILDLGVGGGRTTGHLLELSDDYIGVDYVPAFVEATRRRFPNARIEQADARDLSRFSDASFDFVLFSFNGIDYVSHEDRLQVLVEVHRVLHPGGLFLFSSHNRDHPRFGLLPWQGRPRLGRTTARSSWRALRATRTRRRMRRRVTITPSYAVVNDDAHDYQLLTYYIRAVDQVRQLEGSGFTDTVFHDRQGRPGEGDPEAVWLYYLARA